MQGLGRQGLPAFDEADKAAQQLLLVALKLVVEFRMKSLQDMVIRPEVLAGLVRQPKRAYAEQGEKVRILEKPGTFREDMLMEPRHIVVGIVNGPFGVKIQIEGNILAENRVQRAERLVPVNFSRAIVFNVGDSI